MSSSSWWDYITDPESDHIFVDDYFFCAFPKSTKHYVDREINSERVKFPWFDKTAWEGLQREEFNREMRETDEATIVRWTGSDTNRMEICYSNNSDWYFICKQGDVFFSVSVIGAHPEVHCNSFVFCNSDGSTGHSLNLDKFQDPHATLKHMIDVGKDFIDYQHH